MPNLLYKSNWSETQERYRAWWKREPMDRCLLWISAPRDDAPDVSKIARPPSPLEFWTDLEYWAAVNDISHRRTFYPAEALPVWSMGFPGHASMPTFYGCPFTLDFETGWHDPILTAETPNVSELCVSRESFWWRFGLESLRFARRAAAGKSIPLMHAIFGVGDTLAALRGTQQLLFDLAKRPADVREAEEKLLDDWFEVFDLYVSEIREPANNYMTWFGLWAPGLIYPMQCDCSFGISPATFEDVYLPVLKRQSEHLDQAIYHTDGVGAFHLVPSICTLDRVQAVQILPGAGQPSPLHYLDTLRYVQKSGKNLHISISCDEVPDALNLLSSRGLAIHTSARSESHARELIETAHRLSVDRS